MASSGDNPIDVGVSAARWLTYLRVLYATLLLICRAAVFDEQERSLLVRERADGLWTLPGGWIDVREAPSEAAEREVREETGYAVDAVQVATAYDKLRHAPSGT